MTTLHYAANSNMVVTGGAYTYAPGVDGFNLADVSSLDALNALPAGVKGLVYLGMTDGVTPAFKAAVDQYIGNPKLYGFYVADQPTTVPAANIKAESDYIHANVPGAITFMWIQNTSAPTTPVYNLYNPQNTDIDLFGISPQPVRPMFTGGTDFSVIPDAVNAAVAGGIPLADIVPIYQAFGGGSIASSYTLPTASQEQQIISTWATYVPNPAFDFAYSWGVQDDNAISNEPSLQQVFAAHNAQTGSTPPAPTITSPANGSTTTATPTISGGGVTGDTVTVSIDGTVVGTPQVVAGAWTFTPTSALSNASHTITATQAAAGGPSSPAASDTFIVSLGTAPPAPTIASPANGSTDTTTATPTISGGGVSGDTVTVSIDGTVVGTPQVVAGAWTFTPTSALSNASHTITATQAAPGGPSSPAASDTFIVNVGGGGLTISSAVTGPLSLTATNNPLTITSAGSVKATASGADAIDGGSGVAWSINNSGTVASSQRYGVSLHGAGSSILNSGSISGYSGEGGYGVDLEAGGTVTNTSTGYISGGEDAIFVYGAAGAINNSGQIVSTFDDGLVLYGGGSVINNAGGVIQAPTGGGFGPGAVYIPSGSANVVNRGSIIGQYGVYLGVVGTVENAGTISGSSSAVTFAVSSAANRLIVDPGAVFSGSVKGNGGVLELTAGTGSIGSIGSSSFSGFQTLIDDLGGDWTLTGSNTIANVTDNGSLVAAGSLHVTTTVTSTSAGQFELQAGASLEVASDSAANSQIDFLGASQLAIDNAALFGTGVGGSSYAGPQLEDFGVGDIVDLHSFSAAAAALLYNPASGLLQVTNGSSQVATLDFQNSTLGSGSFSFAPDGSGGVKISHS